MGHFAFGGQKCKLRCPKCTGDDLWLSEVWADNGIYFHVQGGIMPEDAEDHFQGGPICVTAKCMNPQCEHGWRVRGGVHSVYDLVVEEKTSE